MKRTFLFFSAYLLLLSMLLMVSSSCSDNDDFTTSSSARLSFPSDTVKLDTVFSGIGSSTYSFWVHNEGNKGVRINSVRLQKGNQTGFRVNVDGSYLDNKTGSVVNDLEVRGGDSIRVFVELTAPENQQTVAQEVVDRLLFNLESGVEQGVVLRGYSWDAIPHTNLHITRDTLIESKKPVIIYGRIEVDSGATLTIRRTTLYFHDQAGINLGGRLVTDSVTMRGDRLDHMFDYLPYDRVSGQWGGIRILRSSFANEMRRTQLRNATDAIIIDSASLDNQHQRLYMENCIIHNAKGAGLEVNSAYVGILSCQFSNTLGDCVAVYGGAVVMQSCTVAQFYPLSADRGAALRFQNFKDIHKRPLEALNCSLSIFTGYDADVIMGEQRDTTVAYNYVFDHCLMRTPQPENADTTVFHNIIWEKPTDDVEGTKHFRLVDSYNMQYDFRLDSLSTAKGLGCWQ